MSVQEEPSPQAFVDCILRPTLLGRDLECGFACVVIHKVVILPKVVRCFGWFASAAFGLMLFCVGGDIANRRFDALARDQARKP